MLSYANSLPDSTRKKFRIYAYASTWFGCFAEVMLNSSAILILYLTMLGANNTLIMLSTGMAGFCSMILLIPASGFVDKFGPKKMVRFSCYLGCVSYLLAALAPFFGKVSAQYIVLAGCFFFCLSTPLFTAAWYPILGDILKTSERGNFFGFMRFSYYILCGCVFALLGVFMGENPPLYFLQIVIGVTGVLMLGRFYFISKITLGEHELGKYDLKNAFKTSIKNSPLVGFAVYTGFLTLAFSAVIPLILIYLKKGLGYSDNIVQILSSVGITGSICGFFFYGRLIRKIGVRNLQLGIHAAYVLLPLLLFFCYKGMPFMTLAMGVLLFAASFSFACFGCVVSQESMALSRPGNITMATAFTLTYQMIGTACGRTAVSLLLSNGIIATTWKFLNISISQFQTIFLLCAGMACFCFILIFSLPSVIPQHDDYYNP